MYIHIYYIYYFLDSSTQPCLRYEAAQRGVAATKEILKECAADIDIPKGIPIWILDLCPDQSFGCVIIVFVYVSWALG